MTHDELVKIFREWLGISPAAGRMLTALYLAEGEVVRHADLCSVSRQTRNGLAESAKALRLSMDPDSLICAHGTGYRLGAAGMADCEAALADARKRKAA